METNETKYAPVNKFYASVLEEDLILNKSRIKELVGWGRMSFVRYLEENPISAQEYNEKLVVIDGFHRVYTSGIFNLEQIPYISVKEFREEVINEFPLRAVRDMLPVARRRFRKRISKNPFMS